MLTMSSNGDQHPKLERDSKQNGYIEIPLGEPKEERLRLTVIPQSSRGGPGIRIQVREATGHLRPGPEVTLQAFAEMHANFPMLLGALATKTEQ